jgi:prevent-host-death family protein
MKSASILEVKTHLSRLIRIVEAGERTEITRDGRPVAELVPSTAAARPFGIDEGRIVIMPDFDAPLPPKLRMAFGLWTCCASSAKPQR